MKFDVSMSLLTLYRYYCMMTGKSVTQLIREDTDRGVDPRIAPPFREPMSSSSEDEEDDDEEDVT